MSSSKYDFVFKGGWTDDHPAFQDLDLKAKIEKAYQDMFKFMQSKTGIKRCVVRIEYKSKTYSIYCEKS